jgi:hypothetical protein
VHAQKGKRQTYLWYDKYRGILVHADDIDVMGESIPLLIALLATLLPEASAAEDGVGPAQARTSGRDSSPSQATAPTTAMGQGADANVSLGATGPMVRASCTVGSTSLKFHSPMDWVHVRVLVHGTPLKDRPVRQLPREVHVHLHDHDGGVIRFLPLGDSNGGKSAQLYVDSRQQYILKVLLRADAVFGRAAIAREVCISRHLAGLEWAPRVLCHSELAIVSTYVGQPLTPTDMAREPLEYASQLEQILGDLLARGIEHNDLMKTTPLRIQQDLALLSRRFPDAHEHARPVQTAGPNRTALHAKLKEDFHKTIVRMVGGVHAPPGLSEPRPHSYRYSTELMIHRDRIRLVDFGYSSIRGNFTCGGQARRDVDPTFHPVYDGAIFTLLLAWLVAMEPTAELQSERARAVGLQLHGALSREHEAALALQAIRTIRFTPQVAAANRTREPEGTVPLHASRRLAALAAVPERRMQDTAFAEPGASRPSVPLSMPRLLARLEGLDHALLIHPGCLDQSIGASCLYMNLLASDCGAVSAALHSDVPSPAPSPIAVSAKELNVSLHRGGHATIGLHCGATLSHALSSRVCAPHVAEWLRADLHTAKTACLHRYATAFRGIEDGMVGEWARALLLHACMFDACAHVGCVAMAWQKRLESLC